jgi:CHAD domain-containing protein
MSDLNSYILTGTRLTQVEKILHETRVYFTALKIDEQVTDETYYDTFDWRFYKSGHLLWSDSHGYHLGRQKLISPEITLGRAPRKRLKFYWDFPDGEFKDKIESIASVRALIAFARIKHRQQTYRIINDDEKTVCRIAVHRVSGSSKSKTPAACLFVQLFPLKGYTAEAAQVRKILLDQNADLTDEHPVVKVLQETGFTPGDYSAKMDVALAPTESIRSAELKILRHLSYVMEQNKQGIIEDIDSEFLHDFRVSVRRTRSALGQIKEVLPQKKVKNYRRFFKTLAKRTNRLRDLDVYLLNQENYKDMLPGFLREHINPMFTQLRTERSAEHKKVVRLLRSNYCRQKMASWKRFMETSLRQKTDPTPQAGESALPYAQSIIFNRFSSALACGGQITNESPDLDFHRLRIECKKLRYLLEFFSSLFPAKQMSTLVSQLKALQDNLGEFNDLCVQQREMKKIIEQKPVGIKNSASFTAAVGGLLTALYTQQQENRKEFSESFNTFSETENVKLYEELFPVNKTVTDHRVKICLYDLSIQPG